MGFIGAALCVCAARGPRETGWVGWGGGWGIYRDGVNKENDVKDVEAKGSGEKEVKEMEKESGIERGAVPAARSNGNGEVDDKDRPQPFAPDHRTEDTASSLHPETEASRA